jgi:hypothetical protein
LWVQKNNTGAGSVALTGKLKIFLHISKLQDFRWNQNVKVHCIHWILRVDVCFYGCHLFLSIHQWKAMGEIK